MGGRSSDSGLPQGVDLIPLTGHSDHRGLLVEMNRESWSLPRSRQQNIVYSRQNVLRGVHVHPSHTDDLMVISGQFILGLHDIRSGSRTFGQSFVVKLTGNKPLRCIIPIGVAHGFYTPEPTTYIYGLSSEWFPENDFGCRWDDPQVGIDWPSGIQPELSERDQNPLSYDEMIERFEVAIANRPTS